MLPDIQCRLHVTILGLLCIFVLALLNPTPCVDLVAFSDLNGPLFARSA